MSEEIIEGGCLCGAVRYRASGTPSDVTHCHCTLCRRASGAPFVSWASFRSARFSFTTGEPARFASSARAVRTVCNHCGTPLTFQLYEKVDQIDVTICSMDDPERVTPQDHTWTRSQLSWIKLADELPRYATTRLKDE
jgi:hypothetical protein